MYLFRPEKLKKYNCAGTIQDFAVAMLCNLDKPVMSVQNAASWGYFDCINDVWNDKILASAGFPVALLPQVYKSGEIAGVLSDNWHTIPKGTPIGMYNFSQFFYNQIEQTLCFINKKKYFGTLFLCHYPDLLYF